jgi:hypothetical protein
VQHEQHRAESPTERETRLRRARARRLLKKAEGAGTHLCANGQLDLATIVAAAQHDGAEHHERYLRESARLMLLVADEISKKELKVVK